MFRNFFRIFLVVLLIVFVRYVFMAIGRGVRNPPPPRKPEKARQPAQDSGVSQGILRKDPQCGTYVSEATSVKLENGGESHYFCSAACRDEYAKRFQKS